MFAARCLLYQSTPELQCGYWDDKNPQNYFFTEMDYVFQLQVASSFLEKFMQRDWEVIRKILLKIEELPPNGTLQSFQLAAEGIDKDSAAFHMWLLIDAGLVDGQSADSLSSRSSIARRLTWAGCEFFDNIKKDTNWSKVKEVAKSRGLDLTFDVISATAKILMGQLLAKGIA